MPLFPKPPLLHLATRNDYFLHYKNLYCKGNIITFDNYRVFFRQDSFNHCMYESSKKDAQKDFFSPDRYTRVDWIKPTLLDPSSLLKAGWDKNRGVYDFNFRVAVLFECFVVVIKMNRNKGTAEFRTAYYADNSIGKILAGPNWQ